MFLDEAGRLLACGRGEAVGHGDADSSYLDPAPVGVMAGVRVRSVAAGTFHSLALGWDGQVYSWGRNDYGQQGHGDKLDRPSPVLVEGLEGVRNVDADDSRSLAVTQSGTVFSWGLNLLPEAEGFYLSSAGPILIGGFGGVRVRRVCAGRVAFAAFAIGEDGELFSWGDGQNGSLGHGDTHDRPSPKRVEALRGVPVRSVTAGMRYELALTEDGLVHVWGRREKRAVNGDPLAESELLPKPVEPLLAVRVGSIAATCWRSYAVADKGELWAWGFVDERSTPLGHGEKMGWLLLKPIESLRGIKVDAVATGAFHTMAMAGDGGVFTWGTSDAAESGALGLGRSVRAAKRGVPTPQRIPALRVSCGL
jgi:alpha-tubulin suppressor-like RCC1 family protein